jgi:L-fucose mutarotase
MLKGRLTHPDLIRALGAAGHGAKVLIADGNYPVSTKSPTTASRIYLNLSPGLVTATDVLRALVAAIPIEAAEVMVPDSGPEPPIFAEFRTLLQDATTLLSVIPDGLPPHHLRTHDRFTFYDTASQPDVAVAISTGEQRIYANILLTIGVIPPDA